MSDAQPPPPPFSSRPAAAAYASPPPTHPRAVTSLVLGILSLVLCGFFTGIPAIILGRRAQEDIRASNGTLGGDGLALAGIITGAISVVVTGLATLLVVVVFIFGRGRPLGVRADLRLDRIDQRQPPGRLLSPRH